MSYKVRFHLAKGDHFMHFQIKNTETNEVTYADPSKFSLYMLDIKLKNQKATATKINNGAHKTVCAWIEAREVFVVSPFSDLRPPWYKPISYNPRVAPHWQDEQSQDIDNSKYIGAVTCGSKVFACCNS
jgi:hypothetical protein